MLFAAPIPTLVIFMKFLPLVHALFSSLKCIFFYVDYGILYEELLVRAKKTQVVLHMYDLCACTIYAYVYYNISLSLMTTFTNNMAALAVLS